MEVTDLDGLSQQVGVLPGEECGSTRMMVLDLRRVVPGISVDKLNLKERTGVANSNLFSPLV